MMAVVLTLLIMMGMLMTGGGHAGDAHKYDHQARRATAMATAIERRSQKRACALSRRRTAWRGVWAARRKLSRTQSANMPWLPGNTCRSVSSSRQCDRVVKVMDSKSIGLCPQGFESPRCRGALGRHIRPLY
jgi:hypothetical protein